MGLEESKFGTEEGSSTFLAASGIGFVVLGQLFQATQWAFEEKMMKNVFVPPMLLLSVEGTFGSLIFPIAIFPLLAYLPGDDAFGTLEYLPDSLVMISHSKILVVIISTYIL